MSLISKQSVKSIKLGSLVRVNLPVFQGALAIGTVSDIQIVYIGNEVYTFVWVDMTIDGVKRPFTPENLDAMPNIINGFDNRFISDVISEVA